MTTPADIRKLRLRLGLTLEEFGKLCGVTAAAVSLWESGRNRPRYTHLESLEQLTAELRTGKRKPIPRPKNVRVGPRLPK